MLNVRLGLGTIVLATFCSGAMGLDAFQVTNTPDVPEWRPRVWENTLVWDRDMMAIYGRNLTTGQDFTVCDGGHTVTKPDVYGNIVVWGDRRSGQSDIYGYDLATSQEFVVCASPAWQDKPSIDGRWVAWYDNRHGGSVYGYDLNTKTEFLIAVAGVAESHPFGASNGPAVSGNTVVWQDHRNGNYDIYGKNLATGQEFPVCTHPGWQEAPVISGDIVVWMDERNGKQDLYMYDLSAQAELPLIVNSFDCRWPAIDGDIVVWRDDRNHGQADLFGYDLAQGTEFDVCTEPTRCQTRPTISGDRIFWRDLRSNVYDVWGAQLPEPGTLLLVGAAVAVQLMRRKRG